MSGLDADGVVRFHPARRLTREDVAAVVALVARRASSSMMVDVPEGEQTHFVRLARVPA